MSADKWTMFKRKFDLPTSNHQFSGDTLQGINISHLGKRKIIFKMPFLGDMLVPWRVYVSFQRNIYFMTLNNSHLQRRKTWFFLVAWNRI